jgi:membrane fusion protein, heavy metal efflux system
MKKLMYYTLVIIFFAIACKNESEVKTTEVPKNTGKVVLNHHQIKTIQLTTDSMKPRSIKKVVNAIGYFHVPPKYHASVSAMMGGYITSTDLLVGAFVKKGEVLCTIKNPDFIDMQQQFMQAANELKFLKASYERQQKLFTDSISSEKNLLQAEANYKNMLATYQAGKQKLLLLNLSPLRVEEGNFYSVIPVLAPIAGYISANNTSIGEFVSPQDKLLEIIDKSHLHLELSVHEHDAMKIKPGQQVNFVIPSLGQEERNATIFQVGKSLRAEDRTITVHAHLTDENETIKFISGMYLEAEIVIDNQRTASLPEEAVIKSGKKSYIFVKEKEENSGTTFTRVAVNISGSSKGFVGILPEIDLPENAQVVVQGTYYLLSAMETSAGI